MLTRSAVWGLVGAVVIAASGTSPGGPVECVPGTQVCYVRVTQPGQDATQRPNTNAGGSGESRVCTVSSTGEPTPCFSENWGWFNSADDCYYRLYEPQPPGTDAVWEGNYPNGAIYLVSCTGFIPGTNGGWTWLPAPPAGYGPQVTPAELAAQAVDQMALAGPAIGITVPPDRLGLVGVPVWLWTTVTPTTWGPNTATASVPGLSVTATAQVKQIAWDMGDGNTQICPNAGTPWYEGGIESPTCDYIYERPSAGQPGDAYTVRATSTWDVSWTGGGTSGSLTVTRSSSTTVRIGELQVLVTG